MNDLASGDIHYLVKGSGNWLVIGQGCFFEAWRCLGPDLRWCGFQDKYGSFFISCMDDATGTDIYLALFACGCWGCQVISWWDEYRPTAEELLQRQWGESLDLESGVCVNAPATGDDA